MTHFGIKQTRKKKHKCPECEYVAVSLWQLTTHARTHSGIRPFACDVGACEKTFSTKSILTKHRLTHFDIRPYACSQCEKTFSQNTHRILHERTHSTQKVLFCQLCDFSCNNPSHLLNHKKRHLGIKNHICGFGGWCEYKSITSYELKSHKKTHTIEGQIRRKKQEHRLNTMLKEWGYNVDVELTINAKMGKCLADTDRYFSRIDFVVINCVNAILILECDEDARSWYSLKCEFSRMTDVGASLALAGYTAPIYWLRYNPNGKYHIGGEQVKMHRPKREAALKKHLAKLCSPEFQPKHQVNIHYMFYDLGSEEAGPAIMSDPDFPAVVKPYVSWCV